MWCRRADVPDPRAVLVVPVDPQRQARRMKMGGDVLRRDWQAFYGCVAERQHHAKRILVSGERVLQCGFKCPDQSVVTKHTTLEAVHLFCLRKLEMLGCGHTQCQQRNRQRDRHCTGLQDHNPVWRDERDRATMHSLSRHARGGPDREDRQDKGMQP